MKAHTQAGVSRGCTTPDAEPQNHVAALRGCQAARLRCGRRYQLHEQARRQHPDAEVGGQTEHTRGRHERTRGRGAKNKQTQEKCTPRKHAKNRLPLRPTAGALLQGVANLTNDWYLPGCRFDDTRPVCGRKYRGHVVVRVGGVDDDGVAAHVLRIEQKVGDTQVPVQCIMEAVCRQCRQSEQQQV